MDQITLAVEDPVVLHALIEDHLLKGRAFVTGDHAVTERTPCELVIVHQGRSHVLRGETVHIRREDPGRGVGIQLARLDEAGATSLRALIDPPILEPLPEPEPPILEPLPEPEPPILEPEPPILEPLPEPEPPILEPLPEPEPAPEPPAAETPTPIGAADEQEAPLSEATEAAAMSSLHDRIRGLSGQEQIKMAAHGSLAERTILERIYGPTVWETLLRGGRITVPEVARIARKANLPRPLVELVASTPGWLAAGEVQRALLSNLRSSPAVIQKVFNAMPRRELLLVPQQTAYPEPVRAAAKRRLGKA